MRKEGAFNEVAFFALVNMKLMVYEFVYDNFGDNEIC